MSTTTGYVPYDYRRVCDGCGNVYNRSKLVKNGPYLLCPDHAGERIAQTLDRLNARQRPFRILPVPNAKPEDLRAPDVFEAETSTIFALLDFVRAGGARYAQVEAGSPTAMPNTADVIPTNAWACWFYYGLATATYPKGHKDEWHDQALNRIRTAADVLLARQTTTGTRATNSFYGGLLGSGATQYFAEDAAVGGMALLFAFRVLGDIKYITGARDAASFLRNLQAIGSNGVNFTSSDAAGTARLYTGGITSYVSTATGFYSDHRFFPSGLLALRFWNELKLTDGDQSLGATAAIASEFTTAPAKMLSACMNDLRAFFETGTYDVTTHDVRTGLSATTPAEFFNAYPQTKTQTSVTGSGSWEYQNGLATTGTLVSGLNVAKAISSLYAVDGLSAQVQEIDDWLQTFTSNSTFETPAISSEHTLQHATTGTFDPGAGLAQYLQVRDPDTLASTKINGGSLFEWGAFGLMSPIWATRHAFNFKNARYQAALSRRRFSDGIPADGYWSEPGMIRGRQGLSYQTGFRESLGHGPIDEPFQVPTVTTPPTNDMLFWFKADAGVTMNASNQVSNWADQGPNGWDVQPVGSGGGLAGVAQWPVYQPNIVNGLPGLLYTPDYGGFSGTLMQHVFTAGTTNKPLADGAPVTILALAKCNDIRGGVICTFRFNNPDLEVGMRQNGTSQVPISSAQNAHGGYVQPVVDYTGVTMVMDWEWYGVGETPAAAMHVNGVPISFLAGSLESIENYSGVSGFSIGYCNAVFGESWAGWIVEVLVYGGSNADTLTSARNYLSTRAGLLTSAIVYDGLTAAQFSMALRQQPRK